MTNANPSLDPANNDTLTGTLRQVFLKLMQRTDGVLPASVVAFDGTSRVQVQPLIPLVATDGQQTSRAQIASIPVVQVGAGGYFLHFNLKPGDLGLIIACDRDISNFLQSYQEAQPNTARIKNFSDSFFLPCVMNGFTVAGEDRENAVLQNIDGTVRISLSTTGVKITAPPNGIELNSDVLITGKLTVNGRVIAETDLASGGNITAAGTITDHTPIPP
jgi:protein gp138